MEKVDLENFNKKLIMIHYHGQDYTRELEHYVGVILSIMSMCEYNGIMPAQLAL